MIRIRAAIERWRQRRWLGLVVVGLLAGLLVFVIVHDAEHALEDAAAVCMGLVALFAMLVLPMRTRLLGRRASTNPGRGPPAYRARLSATSRFVTPVPLRV